jgi:hypothetical protein
LPTAHGSQLVALALAAAVPAGHAAQVADPLTASKLPAGHAVQAPAPPLLKEPAGQSRQAT